MKTTLKLTILALAVVASTMGQTMQKPFGDIPAGISVTSNNICGAVVNESAQPVPKVKLELKPVSYKFPQQHLSIVKMRVGKTVRKSTTGENGSFDLRGTKPGTYMVSVASSSYRAMSELEILAPSGVDDCRLGIVIETDGKTVKLIHR